MVIIPDIPFRRRRKREAVGPVALALISVEYTPGATIQLNFNQAINISAMVVGSITIKDGPVVGVLYQGVGSPVAVGANAVLVPIEETGPYSGADVLMTVSSANGIVAADDGEAWAGVTDYVVPW